MPRRKMERLPEPKTGYRIDKDAPHLDENAKFETKAACKEEDKTRSQCLMTAAKKHPTDLNPRRAMRLARDLRRSGETGDYPTSPASSLFMGYFRYRLIAALWKLFMEQLLVRSPTTFTIVPRTWEYTVDALRDVDVRKLLEVLRTDLYTMGAAQAKGWLFACLHGEFDPVARVFRLHVHGLCSAEMMPVIDALRQLPRYMTKRFNPDGGYTAIVRPVRITRKPLYNIPAPLTYIFQSFWPSRPIYISKDGKRRRVQEKRRIREPYHSQSLLWLDQWRPQDLTLLLGLRWSSDSLVPTDRVLRRN